MQLQSCVKMNDFHGLCLYSNHSCSHSIISTPIAHFLQSAQYVLLNVCNHLRWLLILIIYKRLNK